MLTDLFYIFINYFGDLFVDVPIFAFLIFFLVFLVGTFIILIPFLMIYALVRRWL